MLIRLAAGICLVVLAGCSSPPNPPAPERLPQAPATASADRGADPQMKEAMEKTQRTLDSFVQRLENPKRGETFSVEATFKAEDNSTVYLWLSDVSYQKGSFSGTISTHPKKATSVHYGDSVSVKLDQVTDWLILKGGRTEGGFTVDILMRREGTPQ